VPKPRVYATLEFRDIGDAEFFIEYCREIYSLWPRFTVSENRYYPHTVEIRDPIYPEHMANIRLAVADARTMGSFKVLTLTNIQ
jgi:hypothetical protein